MKPERWFPVAIIALVGLAGLAFSFSKVGVDDDPPPPPVFDMGSAKERLRIDWDEPPSWIETTGDPTARIASYAIPGDPAAGVEDGLAFAFTYPNERIEDNEVHVSRWSRQVNLRDGSSGVPESVETRTIGDLEITVVTVRGNRVQGLDFNALESDEVNTLIGVIVRGGPVTSIFFRVVAPTDVINAQADEIEAWLGSFRVIEAPQSEPAP